MEVLVKKIVAFPPGQHLAFSGITYTLGFIVSSLKILLTKVLLSFPDPSEEGARSSDELLSQFLHQSSKKKKNVDAELINRNCLGEMHLDVSLIVVESGRLLAIFFDV